MRRRPQPGYVLLVVLVALVVITLLAAAVATTSERAVAQAQADTEAFAAELELASTRDTVLFLLATQRQTIAGLTVDDQVNLSWGNARAIHDPDDPMQLPPPIPVGNEIPLDGTPQRGLGGARFALQDDAGRFGINWTPEPLRGRMLEALGAAPGRWAELEALRLDYQDPDTGFRPGGGEAEAYREEGLPPPPDRTLRTPMELRRMLGWAPLVAPLDDAALMALMTTSRTLGLNPNTAPPAALRMLPGLDEDGVARMLAQRRAQPFLLRWEFLAAFGGGMGEETAPITLLANGAGTLALWNNDDGPVRVLHWTLTPIDERGRPWRIDYEIRLPRDDSTDSTPARPAASPLLADPAAPGR